MAADLHVAARDLFAAVMAPLVLGGDVRPGHAIGGKLALALTQALGLEAAAADLFDHVQDARVRRARRLAPIDHLPPPAGAEWAMSAALHDVLQAANPTFEGTLRRSMARRILDVAIATLDRIPASPDRSGGPVATLLVRACPRAHADRHERLLVVWLASLPWCGATGSPPGLARGSARDGD